MANDLDVKALREHLKETQAEFAARLGVDQGTISNWETGKTSPSGPARVIMQELSSKRVAA